MCSIVIAAIFVSFYSTFHTCVITSFNFHNEYNYDLHLQMRKQNLFEIKSFIRTHLVSN